MLEEVLLETLKNDLNHYKDTMKEVAEEVVRNKVSKYPIFIAHQAEMTIGKQILDKDALISNWSINISTLEEMVAKGVFEKEKVDNFRENYGDAESRCCIMAVTSSGASVIFVDYEAM